MRYEFIVQGAVGEEALAELPELAATPYPTGGAVLFGAVRDSADVRGLLARITSLGLHCGGGAPTPRLTEPFHGQT